MLQLERNIGYYFLLNSEEENNKFEKEFMNYMTNNINNDDLG